jgi:sigma-B regulation protein RsbU (phosphoserine phosphatase)
MLMAQASFAAHFRAIPDADPDLVLRGVNAVLCEVVTNRLRDDKYVTAQLLVHRGGGTFDCAGGHLPPLVYRSASQETAFVELEGPWLGIMNPLPEVPIGRIHLDEGDVLCLYSDGITEARNEANELFDVIRFERAFVSAARETGDLDAIAERLLTEVRQFAAKRDDDWTLLLVKRAPRST